MTDDFDPMEDFGEPVEPPVEETPKPKTAPKRNPMPDTPLGVPADKLRLLNRKTPTKEIHQRAAMSKGGQAVMRDGKPLVLDYVTARYVQDVLDEVCGPAHWQSTFRDVAGGVECLISIYVTQDGKYGQWVGKADVGIPSTIEPVKGAYSDSFKRAGVQWGIARDLYDDRDDVEAAPAEPTVRSAMGAGAAAPAAEPSAAGATWVCPIHGTVKVVPAGISKRSGKAYAAFYACSERDCDETARA